MLKNHLLAKLYYDVGKQSTDLDLQHSHRQEDGEVSWTKRRSFLTLNPSADQWFIERCNHRQILKNEIILDFDRPIPPDKLLEDYDVKRIIAKLIEDDYRFSVFHSGSKGVHIHIFNDWLIPSLRAEREQFRTQLIKYYQRLFVVGLDLQKASDSCMIALEHTPHWKTGNTKTLIYNHNVTAWTDA